MVRVLFYLVILAAGAVLAWMVAEIVMETGARQPGDVALEGPHALHRDEECERGPQFLGLPARDLVVGTVTTLFGILMQSVGRRVIRLG